MKIFIDPGHGGKDPGAVGNGLREKDLALDISIIQKALFEKLGHEVKISRATDVFVDLYERVREANAWGADLFISNHVNSGGGQGVEVWHSIYGGKGKEYAYKVEKELSKLINSRGLKTKRGKNGDYLYVIRSTRMPAILNEFGFIDNASDAIKLKDNTFRQQLAEAVVKGIARQTVCSTNSINGRYGIVTASALNVRGGAGTNYPIIGKLKNNERVKLCKDCGNGWYEIYFGDHGGFVSKEYVRLI